MEPLLEIQDLTCSHGKIRALHGVTLSISEKEIVTLIGANGSGKSTLLKAVSGLLAVETGRLIFQGESLAGLAAHQITRLGIGHVPEGRRIFQRLSVRENLELGAYFRRDKSAVHSDLEMLMQIFPILKERESQLAGTLSGGEQQMLAMGRALMGRPKLLMLDEPSMGLAPLMVDKIFKTIQDINQRGITVLLVEQNAHAALSCAQRGYVLETGRIVLSDSAQALLTNDLVRKSYLGVE